MSVIFDFYRVNFHEAMPPKQNDKKSGDGDKSGDESPKPTGGATGSSGYQAIDLASLIEQLGSMSLEQKKAMEGKISEDIKSLCEKLKAVKAGVKEENKEKTKATREEKQKQINEKKKHEKMLVREQRMTFTINLGAMSIELKVKLGITVANLRRLVGEALNLSAVRTKKLVLTLNGITLTNNPRRTLVGFHIVQGGVINATFSDIPAGFKVADPNHDLFNDALAMADESDDGEGGESEDTITDEEEL